MVTTAKSKFPIDLIESDFVEKRLTFEELMVKYNISQGTLSYYSKKRGWLHKRIKFYNKVAVNVSNAGVKQGAKEQKSLIDRLQYLLDLKLAAETKVFSTSQDTVNKELMHLINKSKDPVGELTKIIELLKGNATGRVEIEEKEKAVRYSRLKEYMTAG